MRLESRPPLSLVDMAPGVDVEPAEYLRLLGYPPGRVLQGRTAELAAWARQWYAVHGRPWVALHATDVRAAALQFCETGVGDDVRGAELQFCVTIDDVPFSPARLRKLLADARAHGVIIAAMSAGPELEAEADRLWREEKPDEYFFLEMYGSAVVEHLAMATGARLCAWAEAQGMAVLPHDSPGYDGWDISEQPRLLSLLARHTALPGPLQTLDSGALVPKKSLVAVYGLTRHAATDGRAWSMVPCEHCSLARCQFRRRPYRHASGESRPLATAFPGSESSVERSSEGGAGAPRGAETNADADAGMVSGPLTQNAQYRTTRKALQRWAKERLTLAPRDDGGIDARFRYDGTTCTNMGRELSFVYEVALGPRDAGYPILAQRCAPAPGDAGHRAMCGYIRNAAGLMEAIDAERPLAGRTLDDVLSWARPTSSAGCYCDASSREHKWGLVLETIHYALANVERRT